MLLSTSIEPFLKYFSIEESIDVIKEAGFDAMDFDFCSEMKYCLEDTDSEAFRNRFYEYRAMAEEKGLCFDQAHAPFPSGFSDTDRMEDMFRRIVRSMRNASYLGAQTIIVHPVQHLLYSEPGVPDELYEMNMKFYRRLLPYCEEYHIKVALENMWERPYGKKIKHAPCSRPEEFIRYLDGLDSEWFVACLDIGHACLVCEDPHTFVRKLGNKRLKALHVHDNNGIDDLHTLPYYGVVEWDKLVKAFREIGYTGNFTYETKLANLPKELCLSGARHQAEIGRYLIEQIDICKNR